MCIYAAALTPPPPPMYVMCRDRPGPPPPPPVSIVSRKPVLITFLTFMTCKRLMSRF